MAAMTDSLAQHRATVEEGKHQRSILNATVASLAQEKADVLREKVALEVHVGTLQDTTESLKRKLGLVTDERDTLQEKVKNLEKRVFLAELNQSVTSRDDGVARDTRSPNSSNTQQALPPLLLHSSDSQHEHLLKEYRPLCETLSHLRQRETELSDQLQLLQSQYEARLKAAREDHRQSIEKIRKRHDEVRAKWNGEIEELRNTLHDQQVKMRAQLVETERKTAAERERERAEWQRERDTLQKQLESEKQKAVEAREKLESKSAMDSEKLASTQHQLGELERERVGLLNRQNELLSCKEELTAALKTADEKSSRLEQSVASTTKQLEERQQKLTELDIEVERLRQGVLECHQEREKEVRKIQNQLGESEALCQELQREKEGLESALVSTQTQRSSLEDELLVIREQLSSVTTQLESSQQGQNEAETNYHNLLAAIEHTISEQNPLHSVKSTAGTPAIPRSPDAVTDALITLKNERDTLREEVAQKGDSLMQLTASLKSERGEAKMEVQGLQSSLQSFQAKFDQTSRNLETTEVQYREYENRLSVLQIENQELKLLSSSLQTQLNSLSSSNEILEGKSVKLEGKLKEVERANKTRVEEVLQLTNTVTVLKSSQINRDRAMAELQGRLQATQREVVEKELTLKTVERKSLALEQRVAQFEQRDLKQENTKRELQSKIRHLECQLKEIKEKSTSLRHELAMSETERETLRGDVAQLSICLQSSTREQQRLAQSQEREIGRLRGEMGRQLQENSALKLELVQSSSSFGTRSSSTDPLVDGIITSTSRTHLQR